MSALPKSSQQRTLAAVLPQTRISLWQRRYLEKHFARWSDEELARGAGLPLHAVREHSAFLGLERNRGAERRLAERIKSSGVAPTSDLPTCWTPATLFRRGLHFESRLLERRDLALVGALFVASLVLYVFTAARTVTGEDAGELIAAAHGLGVPHPPGYPLWTLLGFSFDRLIPFGTVAWRVSMVSAVFAAGANAVLLAFCLKTLRSRAAALLAACLFALSLTHWRQAVIPEVYGLNSFLLALQMLLVLRLAEAPSARRLFGLAVVAGLGATNHTMAVPVALISAVAAVCVAPKLCRRPLVIAGAVLLGLLPLGLFAYLPFASAADPYLDWGNTESWDALVRHVTRQQYTASEATAAAVGGEYHDYLRRLGVLGGSLAEQFGNLWWLPLGALGYVALMARQTGPWLLLLGVGWLSSIAITQYSNFSFDREHVYANTIFYIPAWMVVTWWIGGGLDPALRAALSWNVRFRGVVRPVLAAAGVLGVVGLGYAHAREADRSQTTLVADFGRAVLDVMDEGALYLPSSDHSTFPVLYWQAVEDYRSDVTVADKYGVLEDRVLQAQLSDQDWAEAYQLDPKDRRVDLENRLIRSWDGPVYFATRRDTRPLGEGFTLEPVGPVFKLMDPNESAAWWAAGEDSAAPGVALWDEELVELPLDDEEQLADFTVQMCRADLLYMRGFAALSAGDLALAQQSWARIKGELAPLKQIRNNIGSALAENGEPLAAIEAYELALAEDPDYLLALRNLARVEEASGNNEAAITRLEHAVTVRGAPNEAHYELSALLERAGRPEEALAALEDLARRDNRAPRPWREAARLLEKGGDLVGARVAYQQVVEREANPTDAQQAIERVTRKQKLVAQQAPESGSDPFSDELPPGHEGHDDPFASAFAAPLAGAVFPGPGTPRRPGADNTRELFPDLDPALGSLAPRGHDLVSLPGMPQPPDPLAQLGWAAPGGRHP